MRIVVDVTKEEEEEGRVEDSEGKRKGSRDQVQKFWTNLVSALADFACARRAWLPDPFAVTCEVVSARVTQRSDGHRLD